MGQPLQPSELMRSARRITVKVGSSLLVDKNGLRREWIGALGADLAELALEGRKLVVVSSGAVALGRAKLGLKPAMRLDAKQAAAAAGQPLLMRAWDEALGVHGVATAQLLLTIGDTETRRSWLNARATLDVLLQNGVLPIVNENDSVATEELRYGDNDRLSARVAQMVQSDLLILLSDVDGLYTADPARDAVAEHVPTVADIAAATSWAGPAASGGIGTGGMRTKLAAAKIAQAFGCATIIASGKEDHPLQALVEGRAKATVVQATGSPDRAYKQWIAGSLAPSGTLAVDEGAARALLGGKSLLPSGVRQVEGDFERGACLCITDETGVELARGICRYGSGEARAILGIRASEIPVRLGYSRGDELIHRDDMVLTRC